MGLRLSDIISGCTMSKSEELPEWEQVLSPAAHLQAPLETTHIEHKGQKITVPTEAEMLRIKATLILRRNATRDYLGFVALADRLGEEKTARAMSRFDQFYPQPNGASALQQLQIQLADPRPFDLQETTLSEYKNLNPRWQDWESVKKFCARTAVIIFDRLAKP